MVHKKNAKKKETVDNDTEVKTPEACLCGKWKDMGYVGCDTVGCDTEWWHVECSGLECLTKEMVDAITTWKCPKCIMDSLVKDVATVVKDEVSKLLPGIVRQVVSETAKSKKVKSQ